MTIKCKNFVFIRIFDLVLVSLALMVLFPLLTMISLILKFTGEGEVFFLQERIGKSGKKFKLIKFATMLKNSPHMGTGTVTVNGDPRILFVGSILRKTKINELPQLINIILGDMSLIGPRPVVPEHFAHYPADIRSKVVTVKPGLSGVGSIFFRMEDSILELHDDPVFFYSEIISPFKAKLEEWFVENLTFKLYLRLIYLTLIAVINPNSNCFKSSVFDSLPKPPQELFSAIQK